MRKGKWFTFNFPLRICHLRAPTILIVLSSVSPEMRSRPLSAGSPVVLCAIYLWNMIQCYNAVQSEIKTEFIFEVTLFSALAQFFNFSGIEKCKFSLKPCGTLPGRLCSVLRFSGCLHQLVQLSCCSRG